MPSRSTEQVISSTLKVILETADTIISLQSSLSSCFLSTDTDGVCHIVVEIEDV